MLLIFVAFFWSFFPLAFFCYLFSRLKRNISTLVGWDRNHQSIKEEKPFFGVVPSNMRMIPKGGKVDG